MLNQLYFFKKIILNVCYTILQLNLLLYCVKNFEEEKSLEMLVILFVHIRNVFTKQMKFPWKQTKIPTTAKNSGCFFSILLMLLSFFICRKYSLTLFHISRFKVQRVFFLIFTISSCFVVLMLLLFIFCHCCCIVKTGNNDK